MKLPLILVAASGLAREVMSAVQAAGTHHVVGLLDDDPMLHGTTIRGVRVRGCVDKAADLLDAQFVVCAGSGHAREAIVARLGTAGVLRSQFATVLHPRATLPPDRRVGNGCVVLANVTLTADVTLGDHVVVMPQVVLTHDDIVEDYATLCAGVVLGGGVRVGRRAYLGMCCSVRQGLSIGDDSVVGMGSVVLQNVPGASTWVGVPARPMGRPTRRSGIRAGGPPSW